LFQSLAVRAVPVEGRRKLQLALAVLWLLDGILQFQPAMFTRSFPEMLAATATGNPRVVASPVTWGATLIAHHEVLLNAVFALIQVALGLGIAFRPTVKPALAASVAWSLSVWWLGEGLGGILTGASPVAGAPGAALLYAVLAVLLWPGRDRAPFAAAGVISPSAARAVWLAVWGISALLAATSVSPRPLLAAALAVVALGIYLPPRRTVLILALFLSAALWLAQDLGGLQTGTATDPNTAPLLALLALSYWPAPSDLPALSDLPAPSDLPAEAPR
jgi:hypothetical protein